MSLSRSAAPATAASCSRSHCRDLGGRLLPGPPELVELVADAPLRLLAGIGADRHVRLRAERGADRPEDQLGERPVAADAHAGAGLAALDADVVVLRRAGEAGELREDALALLQLAPVLDRPPADLRELSEPTRALGLEAEADAGPRPRRLAVHHEEVVVVLQRL